MVILVTGGAGFVGSHVVDRLVERGHEVRVVDLLHAKAHVAVPDYLHPEVEYVFGDLRDPDVAETAVRGVGAVSHQASMVGLGIDFADVGSYVAHNDVATAALLRALHDARFRGRFVLASSMVVYGEGRYRCGAHGVVRPAPRDADDLAAGRYDVCCPSCRAPLTPAPIPESAPLDPRNVYAATKLHQEHLTTIFGRENAVAVVALRYHNVYGPRMPAETPYAGVASRFRSALAHGRAPTVLEDGAQLRDFVHVDDVARANVLAIEREEPVDGPLNVASGRPCSVLEMATVLSDAFGDAAPAPVVVGGARSGDVRHVFASTDHAARVLGFRADVDPRRGLRDFARAPLR
jgi:dTDP-L-rhamnose 4-epimerase